MRVYAVWIPLPVSMTRDAWDAANLSDVRVRQFWDLDLVTSRWFASQVDGYDGISWDFYYLYGPDATWGTIPSPLAGTGGTIYAERFSLEKQVLSLLGK
jgi:hypothetical protein